MYTVEIVWWLSIVVWLHVVVSCKGVMSVRIHVRTCHLHVYVHVYVLFVHFLIILF